MLRRTLWILTVVVVGVAGVTADGARAVKDDLILVSRVGLYGAPLDASSSSPSVSADGRFIAFDSIASNVSSEDADPTSDVFVRDLEEGRTILVSRASGAGGAPGDANSTSPKISSDGRFVTFASGANNLSTEDNDAVTNVFVRDLAQATTMLVSRASGHSGPGADDASFNGGPSADGRFVAFSSSGNNLSTEDNDALHNVFVRDLALGTTTLVSRETGVNGATADSSSQVQAISSDGSTVAFTSTANNLSQEDDDAVANVYIRNLNTSTTTLVSRASGISGAGANSSSSDPELSADGTIVAFTSSASNLSADDASNSDIFVRDVVQATTTLVSRESGTSGFGGSDFSYMPSISSDGRYVAFESLAKNFSDADADGTVDVFVRDLIGATTMLISRATGPMGAGGLGNSYLAAISGDSRYVAFASEADNLSPEDNDSVASVFVRDLLGPQVRPPTAALTVDDISGVEGDALVFTVRASERAAQDITFDVSTGSGGEASSSTDFVPVAQSVTIPAGVSGAEVIVQTRGDDIAERSEHFVLMLANPVNATLADGLARGWIFDDDLPPMITIDDVALKEGKRGTTAFTFTIALSAPAPAGATVQYVTQQGTATATTDFAPVSGRVDIAPGGTTAEVTVQVVGDRKKEALERFALVLSEPERAILARSRGVGTIVNDDR